MNSEIYLQVQAALLNSNSDPYQVVKDALRAVRDFAEMEIPQADVGALLEASPREGSTE